MPLTRAEFLKSCGMAVVAPAFDFDWLPRAAGPAAVANASEALAAFEDVSAGRFRAFIHRQFQIAPASVTAELIEVAEGPLHDRVVQYSLIFRCDAAVEEGTYRFTQAELGAFDLFIAPIGSRRESADLYQACISRLGGGA